jgi:hypothetical protein
MTADASGLGSLVRSRARGRGRRRPYGWLVLAGLGILLAATVWLLRTRVPTSFEAPTAGPGDGETVSLGAYELYFGDAAAAGLRRELRFLPRAGELEEDAATVIRALVQGPQGGGLNPWPRETTLEDLFVSTSGVVFVSFNGSLREYAPRGDVVEWLLAATLTRTLCANFPALSGVRVLIDGQSTGVLLRTLPLEWTLTAPMFLEVS